MNALDLRADHPKLLSDYRPRATRTRPLNPFRRMFGHERLAKTKTASTTTSTGNIASHVTGAV